MDLFHCTGLTIKGFYYRVRCRPLDKKESSLYKFVTTSNHRAVAHSQEVPLKSAVSAARRKKRSYVVAPEAAAPPPQCLQKGRRLWPWTPSLRSQSKKQIAHAVTMFVRSRGRPTYLFPQHAATTHGCSGVTSYDATPCIAGSVADDMNTLDLVRSLKNKRASERLRSSCNSNG